MYPSGKDPQICTFPSRSPTYSSPACLSPSECRTLVPQTSLLQPSGILARAGGPPRDPDVPDWTSWLMDQECSDLKAPPWPVSPRSLRRDFAPLPSLSSAELGLARRTGSHSESFRRADNQGLQTQTDAQNESLARRNPRRRKWSLHSRRTPLPERAPIYGRRSGRNPPTGPRPRGAGPEKAFLAPHLPIPAPGVTPRPILTRESKSYLA